MDNKFSTREKIICSCFFFLLLNFHQTKISRITLSIHNELYTKSEHQMKWTRLRNRVKERVQKSHTHTHTHNPLLSIDGSVDSVTTNDKLNFRIFSVLHSSKCIWQIQNECVYNRLRFLVRMECWDFIFVVVFFFLLFRFCWLVLLCYGSRFCTSVNKLKSLLTCTWDVNVTSVCLCPGFHCSLRFVSHFNTNVSIHAN